jgi:hypothetical protein
MWWVVVVVVTCLLVLEEVLFLSQSYTRLEPVVVLTYPLLFYIIARSVTVTYP